MSTFKYDVDSIQFLQLLNTKGHSGSEKTFSNFLLYFITPMQQFGSKYYATVV